LGETTTFTPGDAATLPLAPLDWVGRQVQEDLLVLDGRLRICRSINDDTYASMSTKTTNHE